MTGKYPVLNKRATLTAAITTQTGNCTIQMQISITCFRQLIWMRSQDQIKSRILKCRHRQAIGSYKDCPLSCLIRQCTPTYIFMITHILRLREIHKLTRYRIRMLLYELATLTVGIVINRSTTIISKVSIFLRNFHHIAKTWQSQAGTSRSNTGLQFDRTVRINRPHLIGNKLKVIGSKFPVCQFHNTILTGTGPPFNACSIRRLRFYGKTQYHFTILLTSCYLYHFMLQVMQTIFKPRCIEPVIIVCKGTKCIKFRSISGRNNCFIAVFQAINTSGLLIEFRFKAVPFNFDSLCTRVHTTLQTSRSSSSHFTD